MTNVGNSSRERRVVRESRKFSGHPCIGRTARSFLRYHSFLVVFYSWRRRESEKTLAYLQRTKGHCYGCQQSNVLFPVHVQGAPKVCHRVFVIISSTNFESSITGTLSNIFTITRSLKTPAHVLAFAILYFLNN